MFLTHSRVHLSLPQHVRAAYSSQPANLPHDLAAGTKAGATVSENSPWCWRWLSVDIFLNAFKQN